MAAALQGVQAFRRQVPQGFQDAPVALADDLPVHQIQVGNRHPGLLMGNVQDALPQGQSRLHDGKAADVGLPGGVGPGAEGGNIRILSGDHVDVAKGNAHGVRHHLRIGRVAALADLRFAGLELEGTVLVQNHPAGGGFQGDGPNGGVVPEDRQPHAPADRAGLVLVFLKLFPVVQQLQSLIHALVEGVGIELVLGKAVHIAHGHQIFPAEFQGRHVNRLADVVDVALPGEHGLGNAVAPHGPGGGTVRIHRPAVALHIGAGVELGEGVHALGHDAVAVGGVGPLVGKRLQLPGNQGPVGPDIGNNVGADGVADPVGDEGLLPAAFQLHQASSDLRGAPGAQGLVQRVLLVAKSAADVRLDDPDLAPGKAQGLAHHPADDMGNLGGADHHHPARLLVGETAVVFNVAVLNGGGVVPALHPDEAGLLPGGFIIPPADVGVGQDVVLGPLLNLRRAVLHGLLHVQNEGQLLILHLQSPDRLGGGHLVLGDDHRHLVAVVADVPV